MRSKIKRKKTRYTGIYFNERTKKYDVKYNYKEYNPVTQKNDYKSKWVYNLATVSEAKLALAKLRPEKQTDRDKDKDITLKGAYELWKIKAEGQNFSPVTIINTYKYMNIIYRFLPADTKLRDIDEDTYYRFCGDLRAVGYAEETMRSVNATFRKLLNLAYKKRLIDENILDFADNMKTGQKSDYRVIEKEDFDKLDIYFRQREYWRNGINNYPKYRLLFNLLYYCGLRIGEALALSYSDFEDCKTKTDISRQLSAYKNAVGNAVGNTAGSTAEDSSESSAAMRVRVTKSYISDKKLIKEPKNKKKRTIPLSSEPKKLFRAVLSEHIERGGMPEDRIFPWTSEACSLALKKSCKSMELPYYTCHEFRHTFISNLIRKGVPLPVVEKVSGDTQEMILKRYSHMFEADEILVLSALEDL